MDAWSIHYEVVGDKLSPGDWRVEAIDYEHDGQVRVAIFSGPKARELAEEYGHFKGGAEFQAGAAVGPVLTQV